MNKAKKGVKDDSSVEGPNLASDTPTTFTQVMIPSSEWHILRLCLLIL